MVMLLQRQRAAPLLCLLISSCRAAVRVAGRHSSLSQRIPEISTAPESWKCEDRGFQAPPIAQRHHYRSRGRSEGGFSSAHGSHSCSAAADVQDQFHCSSFPLRTKRRCAQPRARLHDSNPYCGLWGTLGGWDTVFFMCCVPSHTLQAVRSAS